MRLARPQEYRLIIAGSPKAGFNQYWEETRRAIEADASGARITQKIEFVPDEETELYFKAADVLANRHAPKAEDTLERRQPPEALQRGAYRSRLLGGLERAPAHCGEHELGQRRGESGDRTGRAVGEPVSDQRLRPDEHVEPFEQVRVDLLERRVGYLHPREVRRPPT